MDCYDPNQSNLCSESSVSDVVVGSVVLGDTRSYTLPKILYTLKGAELGLPLILVLLTSLFFTWRLVSIVVRQFFSEGKANEQKNLYVQIRGVWYDLAKFNHPGGPVALKLAEGRDATAMFESHHLFIEHKKLYAILNKYKVTNKKQHELQVLDKMKSHYEWEGYESDPFVVEMKAMVNEHFQKIADEKGITIQEASKASTQRWAMVLTMMVAFFATLPWFFAGSWWSLIVTPQLAWVVTANYWHDCLHFSMSTNWKINAVLPYLFPWLSSPWTWYHQHVIGHHAYTNVARMDPDLAHAPQLMREHDSIRWKPSHRYQHTLAQLSLVWSVAVGLGLGLLSDIKANTRLTYNNSVPFQKLDPGRLLMHVLGRVFYVYSLFVWPFYVFSTWKAIVWAIFPIASFSWSFMLSSQVNHLTDNTSHASSPNFLKHQVLTGQDFGNNHWFARWFSGGLNTQIEHHLFPTVNHCHIPDLQPKVKAICEKHGVQYNEVETYSQAFMNHLAHTKKMGIRPFSDDH